MSAAAPMIALTALQTAAGVQQQQAAARSAEQKAQAMQQAAATERVQAQRDAQLFRQQRDQERARERREHQQDLARARVGGASAETLLAGAEAFSLSVGQQDWLTGQQAQGILESGANRAADRANQASAYGAQAGSARRKTGLSLLQGGLWAWSAAGQAAPDVFDL